jgi:hypothetical protein
MPRVPVPTEIEAIETFYFRCLLGLEPIRKCDRHLSTTIQMKAGEEVSNAASIQSECAKRNLERSTPSRVVIRRIKLRGEHSTQLGGGDRGAMPYGGRCGVQAMAGRCRAQVKQRLWLGLL